MSDTPRTNAFYWRETGINPVGRSAAEWAEFTRTLERELAEALRQVKALPKLRISKNGIDYWLHMDAPSGNKASINLGSCSRNMIVDRVIQEMEGL